MAFLFRKKNQNESHLTASDVADLFGVSEDLVEELTKEGKLIAVQGPVGLRYERTEVERYLKQLQTPLERRNPPTEGEPSVNRRLSSRFPLTITCEIRLHLPEKKKSAVFKGVIRNLSDHGVYIEELVMIQGSGKIEHEDPVSIRIGSLPVIHGKIVRFYGRRQEDKGKGFLGIGIYLHGMSPEELEQVKGFGGNKTI